MGSRLNLLLLLTALLTSLTGMISGDRAVSVRVPAAAVAAERAVEAVRSVAVAPAAALARRPSAALPTVRETNVPLPPAFALVPALGLTPENRRE